MSTASSLTAPPLVHFNDERYRGAPVTDFDPYVKTVFDDPHSYYRELRHAGPVVRLSKYGCWVLTQAKEVPMVLSDPQTYSSARGVGIADFDKLKNYWRTPSILLEVDPPVHTRVRTLINRILSPAAVKAQRDNFERTAVELIERLLNLREFDAIPDLAEAFPLAVIPDAFGLSKRGREHLLPYGSMVFTTFGPENELFKEALVTAAERVKWVTEQCRRENVSPGSISSEFYAAVDRGEITEHEAGMLVRALLAAGLDTTVNTLGMAIRNLATFSSEWDKLRADPSLSRAAFEETIRLESPFQGFFRTTTKPVTIAGVEIDEGEKLLLLIASANRDEQRWEDPDRYDITRKTAGHVGFGNGVHTCIGQFLARLEGEVFLAELAKRVGRITLIGESKRRYNNTLTGLSSLPVRFERP